MHPDYEIVKRLREDGSTWSVIGRHLGMARECARRIVGVPDVINPNAEHTIPGETPEQRAFRRFPINSHKPGW
jgi:hypothetical protein